MLYKSFLMLLKFPGWFQSTDVFSLEFVITPNVFWASKPGHPGFNKKPLISVHQVIQSDLFEMVKRPFQRLSNLQLGYEKVTLNHPAVFFPYLSNPLLIIEVMFLSLPGSYRDRSQAGFVSQKCGSLGCFRKLGWINGDRIKWGRLFHLLITGVFPGVTFHPLILTIDPNFRKGHTSSLGFVFLVIVLFHTTVNHHQTAIWENILQCIPSIENLRKIQLCVSMLRFCLNDGYMMVIKPLLITIIHCYMIGVHHKNRKLHGKINPKKLTVASPLVMVSGFSYFLELFQVMKWQTIIITCNNDGYSLPS